MKIRCLNLLLLMTFCAACAEDASVPPPSAPAKRSAADLQKLVSSIALYSDPLVAVILPASAYPLEIVQAARFVKDPNNLSKLDAQPWDDNVKAVARFPSIIQKMNDDLSWTIELGQAFINQQKDVMDAIQAMRGKAYGAGSLRTTPQQTVTVTNVVYQQVSASPQIVYVTNTVVQVQPAQKEIVYVPQYDPTIVYASPPPNQSEQAMNSLLTFGMGMAMGAVLCNSCNWHGGVVYVGPYNPPPPPPPPPPPNPPPHHQPSPPHPPQPPQPPHPPGPGPKPWQPDQNRLHTAGASPSTANLQSREIRGWSDPDAAKSAVGSRSTVPGESASHSTAPGAAASRSSGEERSYSERSPSGVSRSTGEERASSERARSGAAHGSAFGDVESGSGAHDFSSRGASSRGEGRLLGGGRMGRR
ncbi:MAG: DUF3300 domain-containing protein [Verrucomicrobiae bacterium]|nr:DUF3300 domain-containing protein [Verrucomicrobiae bacterium]